MATKKTTNSTPSPNQSDVIVLEWIKTNNLKNIDLVLPKNQIITFTWVSGSGKSSLAFETIYKEGQFRYIESLSSYLRQFFNLWERPDIAYCAWLSPAIAIEQNKRGWNSRSTVWTLTEIDDYTRLLFAKVWESYCYNCGAHIKPKNVDQIMWEIKEKYFWKKLYLLKESGRLNTKADLQKFVKNNRSKIEKWSWFTRYLLLSAPIEKDSKISLSKNIEDQELSLKEKKNQKEKTAFSVPIEYFYLEDPVVKDEYFPLKIFWIYDRISVDEEKLPRLKEDIIKILWEAQKFWVYVMDKSWESASVSKVENTWLSNIEITSKRSSKKSSSWTEWNEVWGSWVWVNNDREIERFTDKMFCPNCNITYPEFTTQHFSPNRWEWACECCHGLGEILQVDFDKIIEPNSPLKDAILPWRDSNIWQAIFRKLCEKYDQDLEKVWKDQPDWFLHVVVYWDNEELRLPIWSRIPVKWKWASFKYVWMEDVIKDQFEKWMLTVDFQAMLDMKPCPECFWSKIKKESLHVFLTFPKKAVAHIKKLPHYWESFLQQKDLPFTKPEDDWLEKINIWDLQKIPLQEMRELLQLYINSTTQPELLIHRITNPLLDRVQTIEDLGLGYLTTNRQIDTLSWWEIQRLRLAKQLWNKLTWIVYVLDEPTIWLDVKEIERTIQAIRKLKDMWNTIMVVEHNEEFIEASDWIVEIWPGAGDFGWELIFSWPYSEFLKSDCLTAQYMNWKKKVEMEFNHKPTNKRVKIRKASKFNLQNIDVKFNLWSFTVITWWSGAWKTTLMYTTLYRFLNDKEKFVQSYIRLQMLKKWYSWEDILAAPIMRAEEYAHYENMALQEFYKDLAVDKIEWYEEIKNTIYVDQSSIWKTPRSCPSTFVWTFDRIRDVFANTSDAKYLWFHSSYFSFNSDKWACPACNWYGYKKIELQFLPDTYVPCELCKWKRYKPEVLWIKWRWKTIADVLDMYISDALEFFHEMDNITRELQLMCDIWLWYLKMWQSAHMLSWWESQRLKLVRHLLKDYRWHCVYFLDEPTVWLHPDDISRLLWVLKSFLERWDTILMIEHDQTILRFADQIIHLENGELIKNE